MWVTLAISTGSYAVVRWRYSHIQSLLKARDYSWLSFGKALGFSYDERVYRVFREDGRFKRLDERLLSKVCETLRVPLTEVLEYIPDDSLGTRQTAKKRSRP